MSRESKVLVVDDEPKNVKLLAAYLKADGFMPLKAYSGEEAIALAIEQKPDVILLDIMMPNMDGYEVTARLKTNKATRMIPIVLVTSLDGANNRSKGLNVGADEFLTKPVNRSELIARVRALHRMKMMHEELIRRREILAGITDSIETGDDVSNQLLIIEDDELLARQAVTVLSAIGFDCSIAENAQQARDHLSAQLPDVILLDRMLPDGDGIELLIELKQRNDCNDVPVIVITAMDDIYEKVSGIESGADDYLIKPVEIIELQARVKAALRRSKAVKRLRGELEQAVSTTVTDRLTGTKNRFYLDADLDYRLALFERNPEKPLSVLMIDVDHFKSINDKFGHVTGDKVLCQIAEKLMQAARSADIVTRYGGEEFCVVLPETDIKESVALAERMRESVEHLNLFSLHDKSVTVSIGVAEYQVKDHDKEHFLERADKALYKAKEKGRNCVVKSLAAQSEKSA